MRRLVLARWPRPPCWPPAPARRRSFSYTVARPARSRLRLHRPSRAGPPRKFAVAAANPLATDAGYQVLKAGGSAIDAAIAVQMVLTLVEPQSSGIGGGAFLLHFDGQRGRGLRRPRDRAGGGRRTPVPRRRRQAAGLLRRAWSAAARSACPARVRMLEMAHRQHGKLPWAALFQPAIALAENGFKVSPRLHTLAQGRRAPEEGPDRRRLLLPAPTASRTPSATCCAIPNWPPCCAASPAKARGPSTRARSRRPSSTRCRGIPTNPGRLALADLAGYQPKKRAPLCHDYRAQARDYRVCGFPPPELRRDRRRPDPRHPEPHADAATLPLQDGLPSADWLHLYTEAARLAFADRAPVRRRPGLRAAARRAAG